MNLLWVLIVILLVLALLGSPIMGGHLGHSFGWGPSGIGLILIIILIVVLLR